MAKDALHRRLQQWRMPMSPVPSNEQSFFQTRGGGRHIAWGLCRSWAKPALLREAIAGIFGFR
jgi:hypothetical protein